MLSLIKRAAVPVTVFVLLMLICTLSFACTGIRLTAEDGSVIYARTLEFGAKLDSEVLFLPRDYAFTGTTASGRGGLTWQSKYAALGLNGLGYDVLVDGINEKGLAAGAFYMPGYAAYEQILPDEESGAIAPWEVVTWILTNFSTIEEVRAALPTIKVAGVPVDTELGVPPLHFITHDAQGSSLVIEYLDGKLQLHDNPLGVITNSPSFDWHVTNLRNYINLTATNVPDVDIHGIELSALGQGSGLHGLPGDFTPPSRFVRAVALSQSTEQATNGADAVAAAFHVLDSFDIPLGTVRALKTERLPLEYTQWTSAADLKNLKFYFHTYDNRRIRSVSFDEFDLTAKKPVTIALTKGEDVEVLTSSPQVE